MKLRKGPLLKFKKTSFTLVELLIVTAIIAVLFVGAVLVLNPTEIFRQGRDSVRLTDMNSLNVDIYLAKSNISLGVLGKVYVSIPDSSATCANLNLPPLPPGQIYSCVTSSTLTKIDGTGWLPINFTQTNTVTSFDKLPIDPINSSLSGNYYTYTTGDGIWELTALFESQTQHDVAIKDGGSMPGVYEVGSNLALGPTNRDLGLIGNWDFEEGGGSATIDYSMGRHDGSFGGPGPHYSGEAKVGHYAGEVSDPADEATIPDSNDFKFLETITACSWVNFNKDNGHNSPHVIAERRESGGGGKEWSLTEYDNAWSFTVLLGPNQAQYNVSSSAIDHAGAWHFICGLYDGSAVKLYVDGEFKNQRQATGALYKFPVSALYLGLNGPKKIDNIRVYDHALSSSEIKAIYNSAK